VQDVDCFAGGFFLGFCFVGRHDVVLVVALILSSPRHRFIHVVMLLWLPNSGWREVGDLEPKLSRGSLNSSTSTPVHVS
jgi:hypothetical protein